MNFIYFKIFNICILMLLKKFSGVLKSLVLLHRRAPDQIFQDGRIQAHFFKVVDQLLG